MKICLLLFCLLSVGDAYTWGWAKSGEVCGGIITNCNNAATCTETAVGPCKDATTGPADYLKSDFVSLIFVKESDYLTNSNSVKAVQPSGPGYRDYSGKKTIAGTEHKYSYVMTGNTFGDMDVAGGYVGIASYLNVGSTTIETNRNDVYVSGSASSQGVARGDSDMGAPLGPYTVCITDDTNCGGTRQFQTGEYKFSVFGYTSGSQYADDVKPGVNDFPVGMDHVGVRMKLSAVGFKLNELKVNGRSYDESKTNEDVTKFTIVHDDGELTATFPQKYNYGSNANAQDDGTLIPVTGTKNVKIRMHGADAAAQTVFVDYLFDRSDLSTAQKYFMYDPTLVGHIIKKDSVAASTGSISFLSLAMVPITSLLMSYLI